MPVRSRTPSPRTCAQVGGRNSLGTSIAGASRRLGKCQTWSISKKIIRLAPISKRICWCPVFSDDEIRRLLTVRRSSQKPVPICMQHKRWVPHRHTLTGNNYISRYVIQKELQVEDGTLGTCDWEKVLFDDQVLFDDHPAVLVPYWPKADKSLSN